MECLPPGRTGITVTLPVGAGYSGGIGPVTDHTTWEQTATTTTKTPETAICTTVQVWLP